MGSDWKRISGLTVAETAGNLQQVDLAANDSESPLIVWLGHASFLLRWQGVSLVVDPVFRNWIGVVRRILPLPILSEIGPVDAALVSHGHMDHLDRGSLGAVRAKSIVIPSKTAGMLGKDLRRSSVGVELWQELAFGPLSVTVVPARHGGWRFPWQRGYFACGFVISDGTRVVYAAGDSAYGPQFGEIGQRWKIDTALLPIGAYSPQWFLQSRHLNPEEACRVAVEIGASEVIPFHFGTYRLSLEPNDEPLRRFAVAAERAGLVWRIPFGLPA